MSATFARVLSRADLLLFSVSALLALDTLASAASVGVSWFGWWAITLLFFFLPYGLMMAELGAAWPGEGGAYIWVREAMGARLGSLAAWFYWINNAYWRQYHHCSYLGCTGRQHRHRYADHICATVGK